MNLISGTEGVVVCTMPKDNSYQFLIIFFSVQDVDVAKMFISEFKRTHLRMGELWAFPIMLRYCSLLSWQMISNKNLDVGWG